MRRLLPQLISSASPARSISSCHNIASKLQTQPRSPFNPLQPTSCFRHQFSHSSTTPSPSPFRLTSTPEHTTPTPTPTPTTESNPPHEPPNQDHNQHQGQAEYYSPYKPKRQWPPDMSKLSPKHQFRLERKYRRRAALKYARPKWTKATKLVQWGGIGFVLLYALLFMEWDDRGGKPVEELRTYIFGTIKGAFSAPPSPVSMRRSEDSARE
ncbi:hypothetical protein BDW59DRAFT_19892 [Aspergillus cavernicola]|uniref:Uncharacterized protein n=1 Tax=Aspergillus cavernicola TaxID=176166 RepID=A0ABR4HH28_9EURO